jgi:transcriptional regulator NrdR family protein
MPETNTDIRRCACPRCHERFDSADTMELHLAISYGQRTPVTVCKTPAEMRAAGLEQNAFGRWHVAAPENAPGPQQSP